MTPPTVRPGRQEPDVALSPYPGLGGVPIPPKRSGRKPGPLARAVEGLRLWSVIIRPLEEANRLRSAVCRARMRTGQCYIVRTVVDRQGKQWIGAWRTG